MSEVDRLILGSPREEGPLCITPASEKISPNRKVQPGPGEELFTHPTKFSLIPRDVAGKWASPWGAVVIKGFM